MFHGLIQHIVLSKKTIFLNFIRRVNVFQSGYSETLNVAWISRATPGKKRKAEEWK